MVSNSSRPRSSEAPGEPRCLILVWGKKNMRPKPRLALGEMTSARAAQILKLHPTTVNRHCRLGTIKARWDEPSKAWILHSPSVRAFEEHRMATDKRKAVGFSVAEAGKRLGYSREGVRKLCQQGRVDARMVSGTWRITGLEVRDPPPPKPRRIKTAGRVSILNLIPYTENPSEQEILRKAAAIADRLHPLLPLPQSSRRPPTANGLYRKMIQYARETYPRPFRSREIFSVEGSTPLPHAFSQAVYRLSHDYGWLEKVDAHFFCLSQKALDQPELLDAWLGVGRIDLVNPEVRYILSRSAETPSARGTI